MEAIDVRTLHWLTDAERQRLEGMASAERRASFLAGHRLARALAASWHGVDAARVAVDRHDDGRPSLLLDGEPSPLSLSLSHSGGWVVAAVSTLPIGVDVEVPRRTRDFHALARRAFAPEEASRLASVPLDMQAAAFHELWALKEARGKRSGEGLLPARARRVQAVPVPSSTAADAMSWRLERDGAVALALQGVGTVQLDDGGRLDRVRHWRFDAVGEG